MSTGRRIAAGVLAALMAVAVAAFSQWSVPNASDDAFVRLSWRTEPLRMEECRTLTEEELARVPAHMRRTEECVGDYVDYELVLGIDDGEPRVDTIKPSGIRRDRPVYVLRDVPVVPGNHRVAVTFRALVPPDFESDEGPITLEWSGRMTLGAGEVGLVTHDPTGTALELRQATTP